MKSILLILSFLLFGTFQIEANNFNPAKISTEDPIAYSWSDSNINIYPNPATIFSQFQILIQKLSRWTSSIFWVGK